MKKALLYLYLIFVTTITITAQCPESFHDFSAIDIHGNNVDMLSFAGKKVLVVNTASYCGYTSQYAQLQQLYQTYGGISNPYNFEIIGFPANNFQNQEPYNEDSILNVCESYGVTFTMMSKISVKGSNQHEIYKWLTMQSRNCVQDAPVAWNFQKFLINPDGSWHASVATATSPTHSSIVNWITSNTSIQNLDENYFNVFIHQDNKLTITTNNQKTESFSVQIINMIGQELAKYELSNSINEISLNNLSTGIYLIHITNKNNSHTEKVFVK